MIHVRKKELTNDHQPPVDCIVIDSESALKESGEALSATKSSIEAIYKSLCNTQFSARICVYLSAFLREDGETWNNLFCPHRRARARQAHPSLREGRQDICGCYRLGLAFLVLLC